MDIERKNLEIIFKEIPYHKIDLIDTLDGKYHTCDIVSKEIYLKYARRMFPYCSEDEIINNYFLLVDSMKGQVGESQNIFYIVYKVASRMLTLQSGSIQCRLSEMLRWRDISFQLGQELFTCAFLAGEDIRKGMSTKFFAWEPIVNSDDMRLNNILKRGIAENHFHLNGSTKIFELNWICLMNHIENRGKEFRRFESILQHDYVNALENEEFYQKCQKAALYRLYLFSVLRKNKFMADKLEGMIRHEEDGGVVMWECLSELQDMISLAGVLYGAVNEQEKILDYALQKDTYDDNNNPCRLLAGERRFLYGCYKKSLGVGKHSFSEFDKNVFYRYLVLRTYFRGEMVQINRRVGFSNFDQYQLRKEYFIEGRKEYECELIHLAVNASFMNQEMVSLEARICPSRQSDSLAEKINHHMRCVSDLAVIEKLFFVLHFPKQKEERNFSYAPRNEGVRKRTEKYANAIVALLEKEGEINRYIRGIDACSTEIGCRPEVFAQYFRYLLDYSVPKRKDKAGNLRATYHVGEDFFDIVDGLRAIDEVMLFCGLPSGSRLGHALALGVNAANYYKFKGNVLVMPKQDLLDDLAWLLIKQGQYGCPMDEKLRSLLERKFYELFDDIYSSEFSQNGTVTILDYYNSWMLRGDYPGNYRLHADDFEHRLVSVPLQKLYRYEFNASVPNYLRKNSKYRELYMLYHYDRRVREKGASEGVFKVPCGYDKLVEQIQDSMIQELVCKGIGIETNPSSNYLIGPLQKYEEHPVIRFNGRKLKVTETNMSLQVSINTDDQGVFDTSLENEYALMAIALKKAKTEDDRFKYDTEDIYAWIDYVRRMGITQTFYSPNQSENTCIISGADKNQSYHSRQEDIMCQQSVISREMQ